MRNGDSYIPAIQKIMIQLGATPNYVGFRYCVTAICLVLEDSQRLLFVTKQIYMEIAEQYHTTDMAVERNIRTVVEVMWRSNPEYLRKLAGYKMTYKPTVSQFIGIISSWLMMSEGKHI